MSATTSRPPIPWLTMILLITAAAAVVATLKPNATAAPTSTAPPTVAAVQPVRADGDRATQPDIVVIMTDDQRAGTQRAMPYTWDFFTRARGVDYPNTQIPTNLCCPARIAFLTGQYPTTTGGWDNGGPFGGAKALKPWQRTLMPYRLYRAGYHTGLFGKYVNGYGSRSRVMTPPGWDAFHVYDGKGGAGYWKPVRGLPRGYTTDTLGAAAADFIATAPTDRPLFTYYTPFGPHAPYDAGPYTGTATAEQHATARTYGQFGNPSYDTVTDGQPDWLHRIPPLAPGEQDHVAAAQTDTLTSIDANVERIVNAVAQHRDLNNTLFVFMSDNGYGWGDHRLVTKRNPYVTTNEIPLMVRYPAGTVLPDTVTDHEDLRLSNNVDITATILDTAGVNVKGDGQPLTTATPRRHVPLMAAATIARRPELAARPAYCGTRTHDRVYVAYGSGEEELYDLTRDPYQLLNQAHAPGYASDVTRLRAATRRSGCDLDYLTDVVEPHLPPGRE